MHPSLLPHFRGATPYKRLSQKVTHTGISIMLLDNGMDTGPLLSQKEPD